MANNSSNTDKLNLLTACLFHWHDCVEKLLDLNHYVSLTDEEAALVDEEGNSALHYLARRNVSMEDKTRVVTGDEPTDERTACKKIVDLLVKRGAVVSRRNKLGRTALHVSAASGNDHVVSVLVEYMDLQGVNSRDYNRMTALHLAASSNQSAACSALLQAGANIQCHDKLHATPLHHAASKGHYEITRLLIKAVEQRKEDVLTLINDQDSLLQTPLHLAVKSSQTEVAKCLIVHGADVNLRAAGGETPLQIAAITGDPVMVTLLLQNAAVVNSIDNNRMTPLFHAIKNKHGDILHSLMRHGSYVSSTSKFTCTPLLLAARTGNHTAVGSLVEKGASLLERDKYKRNAIYFACLDNNWETLDLLVRLADHDPGIINNIDVDGNTPLHTSSMKGHVKCVQVLMENGADPFILNMTQNTALHVAATHKRYDVVQYLVSAAPLSIELPDSNANTALHLASINNDDCTADILIKAGSSIEARNISAWTALHCAAERGATTVCELLLDKDAPINAMDTIERTPLLLAVKGGHVETVKLLIDSGADVLKKNLFSESCLDLAIKFRQVEVAKVLVRCEKWKHLLRTAVHGITPMRNLLRHMPEVVEIVLDNCVTVLRDAAFEFDVNYNYEFIDDTFAVWREDETGCLSQCDPASHDKWKHPLIVMVEHAPSLLDHELVKSLLNYKWSRFGWYVYYVNLLFYLLYLTFFTGYICCSTPPYRYVLPDHSNCTANSCQNIVEFCSPDLLESDAKKVFVDFGRFVIIACSCISIVKEIVQCLHFKLRWENVWEWVIFVASIAVVTNFTQCQRETGIREQWQWELATVAIVLAWFELVLFIRKLPHFGVYVVMFTQVLKSFLQFVIVFFIMMVGFALAFNMMFSNQFRFMSVGRSLLSTGVMMLGEFDYADLFYSAGHMDFSASTYNDVVHYKDVSYLVFVCFVVMLAVITMNLLIGLAVDDIKEVQRIAIQKRLVLRVELALQFEKLMPVAVRKFLSKPSVVHTFKKGNPHEQRSAYGADVQTSNARKRWKKMVQLFLFCGGRPETDDRLDEDDMKNLRNNVQQVMNHLHRADYTGAVNFNAQREYQRQVLRKLQELEALIEHKK